MKKIFLITALACAFIAPTTAAAQEDAQEPAEKRDYSFKSAKPLTQIESLYTSLMAATPKGVQNTLGLELIAGNDSIQRMALNPTGINVALVKKDKKGRYYLEALTTDGKADKLMTFDSKHLGIPYAAAFTPDARQLAVATDKATYLFDTKKFKPAGEAPAFTNRPDMLVFSPNAYFLAAAGERKVEVMNFEEKTMRRTINPGEPVTDVVFSKSSEDMAVLTADGMVEIYDTRSFNVRMMIEDLDKGCAADFNFDGKYLAVAADADKVTVVNLLKPEDRIFFEVPGATVSDISFISDSFNNTLIAAATADGISARRLKLEPYYAKLVSDEVDMKMAEWLKKMPDESMEEYQLRVNNDTRAKQRRLFEDEISTRLAGNLTAMSTISLGQYDADNEVLAVNFDNMPTIFLPMPREDLGGIHSASDLTISDQQYGLLGDDSFELIYAKFTNNKTGAEYIYDNVNRKPMNFMNNDNVVSIELVQQQMMEEIRLEELKEQVMKEAKKDNIISDHTQIAVNSEVVPDYDANGNKILNYNVNITYQVDPEFSAQEDFAPGKYRAEQSGAASSMLSIVKNAFEGDFANYVKPGKRLNVRISGTADASPIRGTIAYDGAYGDIENEPIHQDNTMRAISVTQKEGIRSNEQLAFLRAYGVKEFLRNNVEGLNEMDTRYTYNIGVSEDEGSEFRRIGIEFTFIDAF